MHWRAPRACGQFLPCSPTVPVALGQKGHLQQVQWRSEDSVNWTGSWLHTEHGREQGRPGGDTVVRTSPSIFRETTTTL